MNSLGPTRSIFGSLVVHASLPKGRDVAPSVPWLMLSWAGAMAALATFGRPVVTLQFGGQLVIVLRLSGQEQRFHWLDRVIADTLVGYGSNESNVRVRK